MTGIFLIAVFIFWLMASIWIARCVSGRLNSKGSRVMCALLLFPIILIAPVTDEIIGMHQFSAVCKKYAVMSVDEKNAMDKNVIYVRREVDQYLEGGVLRIRIDPVVFKDAITGDVLVSYHTAHAEGGWLIRLLGISETDSPLLFNAGCAPENQDSFKKKFNIKVLN